MTKRAEEKQTRILSVKKPTLVPMSADECKRACDKIGVVYMPGYENRILQYIVSSEVQDRYGDIVRANGARFENYMKNPVMFFAHNYNTPPIGNTLKTWIDKQNKQVLAWGLLLDDKIDTTGLSELIFRMASSGFMRACSVGFMPIKANVPANAQEAESMGLGKYGIEFTEWDMLEWSPCGVPANPTALQNTLKDVGSRLQLTREHIDAAQKFNVFPDSNLIDMLWEYTKNSVSLPASVKEAQPDLVEQKTVINVNVDLSELIKIQTEIRDLHKETQGMLELVKQQSESILAQTKPRSIYSSGSSTNDGTLFRPINI